MPDTITPAAKLSTRAWLESARAMLIRDGIHAVKIDRLARECGVTRGGFYWRFSSHAELLAALLDDWRETNTAPMLAALDGPDDPDTRFARLARLWVDEQGFSSAYDAAVREWARGDAAVRAVVHAVDDQRIGALCGLFLDYGYGADEALVRARITYYHQVGYYALDAQRDDVRRSELTPLYIKALTGPLGRIIPTAD
ncbi:AcrR family transcriptional regulator [Sphingomonas sp. SORGH_AS 950]|uniref:TetR/AcrR family transcriptional regulator n=1 Tax=Sphingomonas sp. SORGH_AS_0950 TaxID=3041792 RepID=UPI00277D8ACA|nr:TetR/AcrR family transcriptional regulator [Sphingomonas sp. SORGH_AS_0950]MDQ1158971.1 AcrR family transcriptional regulator [Sphingomonas sp. SORGH_AS_0950]